MGDVMIIVAWTAAASLSKKAGGAATQPSRMPGKQRPLGQDHRQRRALRRQEAIDIVLDDDQPVAFRDGGDLPAPSIGHHR
jgi:hypothetical protein